MRSLMNDLTQPSPRRVGVPIVDAHCHLTKLGWTAPMFRAAEIYGISKLVGICELKMVEPMRRRFGSRVEFNIWMDHSIPDDPAAFARGNVERVRRAVDLGCCCVKFWYKPQFNEKSGLFLDDWRLDPVFAALIEADMPVMVHIADPDIWWRKQYRDRNRFESKRHTYRQLTNMLGRYPELNVVAAHLGGHPEDLGHLDELLDQHPNLRLDTSATKWVARELSRQPRKARRFIINRADRLLFGTDVVPFKGTTVEHHCARYAVHQHLWEGRGKMASPIPDADAGRRVQVAGLNLPDNVLERIYHVNAVRFFGLTDAATKKNTIRAKHG